jgi:transaldolase
MGAIEDLVAAGQSIWLDNISRRLITSGTLERYIADYKVTGLTSNPSILSHSISGSGDYDAKLREVAKKTTDPEEIVYELAVWDLTDAAKLFLPVWERTKGLDGYVSIEVPPELADDTANTVDWAKRLRARFDLPNVLIKVPGTVAGADAVRQLIADGIAVNVTLLFSVDQYMMAATAYIEGIEDRIGKGKDPKVGSVASVFVSRWDSAVNPLVPPELQEKAGLAVMAEIWAAYSELISSNRVRQLLDAGAWQQRLLWASTSTKDPNYPDTYYLGHLVAPGTIDTVPEKTLLAFKDHGKVEPMLDGSFEWATQTLAAIKEHGVDLSELSVTLQHQGAKSFVADWEALLDSVKAKLSKL